MSDRITGADAQVRWNRAVRVAGEEDDTTELVSLLETLNVEVTTGARKLIADLIKRHQLKKKPGRQQIAINRSSMREMHIASAVAMVRRIKQETELLEDEAITAVAEQWRVTEDTLRKAVNGRRGSARRARGQSSAL